MRGIKKWTTNEKLDNYYGLILSMLFVIIYSGIRPSNNDELIIFMCIIFISSVPRFFRMRKIKKEVPVLLNILGISIDELREATNISKYDLGVWEKDEIALSRGERYDIEDYLLKEYFFRFHKEFVWKDYLKQEQNIKGRDNYDENQKKNCE